MQRILTSILLFAALTASAAAKDGEWRQGTSLVGETKYPTGFARFDYVNPDAPKGGTVRLSETGTFDSLNFVPPRGSIANGLGLIYDTLMTPSLDEVSTRIRTARGIAEIPCRLFLGDLQAARRRQMA